MEESEKYVKVEMDMSELDDVLKKVERLRVVAWRPIEPQPEPYQG